MQQNNGDVLAVCGGYSTPGTGKMWRECPQVLDARIALHDDAPLQLLSHPYSEKRLDAGRIGHARPGLPAKLVLAVGLTGNGEQLPKTITRLRQHKLPAYQIWLPSVCMRWRWQ